MATILGLFKTVLSKKSLKLFGKIIWRSSPFSLQHLSLQQIQPKWCITSISTVIKITFQSASTAFFEWRMLLSRIFNVHSL